MMPRPHEIENASRSDQSVGVGRMPSPTDNASLTRPRPRCAFGLMRTKYVRINDLSDGTHAGSPLISSYPNYVDRKLVWQPVQSNEVSLSYHLSSRRRDVGPCSWRMKTKCPCRPSIF